MPEPERARGDDRGDPGVPLTAKGDAADRLLDESAEELYEHAPAGYLAALPDGTIAKANETLLRWTGHERGAVVGKLRLHDLLPPGARIYYETHIAPLLQMQGEISEIATELVRVDGTRLPILLNAVLVRDDDGSPQLVRATVFDASERRRYERELLRARAEAESRARASLALSHVVEGVIVVDERGRIELLNPAAERILAVNAACVVGKPAVDELEGWGATAARVKIARGGETAVAEVLPLLGSNGERWLSVAASDAGDAVVYTLRDVTAERDLDQLRAEMIAIVSHELRTPLTGVYGAAQTLATRYDTLTDENRHAFLQMLVEQSERLSGILDQILLASSLDARKVTVDEEVFDAADAVEVLLGGVEPGSRRRVIVDVPPRLLVRTDLDRLRQVLGNLVDNAIKYSNGPVRLCAEARELAVRFTVADDGPGIPVTEREHVFEKFFRLDPDQNRGVGGTGLGLYIARELTQRLGGRIGFLPRAHGTTIFVDVPRG